MGDKHGKIVVGVTGASGAAYARRLVQCLVEADTTVHLVVSDFGKRLLIEELALREVSARAWLGFDTDRLIVHPYRDVGCVLGSGSFPTDGMVICPCSANTLGSIAGGLGGNLIDRAAAVTIKEQRRLVLVPREMPLSTIDLQNALRLSQAGVIICPASPGFYMHPSGIDDLVDFVVGKVLDLLTISHTLNTRWTGERPTAERTDGREAPA